MLSLSIYKGSIFNSEHYLESLRKFQVCIHQELKILIVNGYLNEIKEFFKYFYELHPLKTGPRIIYAVDNLQHTCRASPENNSGD